MRVKLNIDCDLDLNCLEVKIYGKRKCIRAIKNAIYEMLSVFDLDAAIDELDITEEKIAGKG